MVKIIYLFLFLALVIFGIVFAVLNAEPVQLNYYFGSANVIISNRREVVKLRKSIQLAEKEVANLRAIPIRDDH